MSWKFVRLRRAAWMLFLCACPAAFGDITAAYQPFTLTWTPPVENEDGSPLTDLLGYYVYVGDSPEGMLPVWFIGADSSSVQLSYGATGDYYFAVSAINADGIESARTEAVVETVQ